MKKKPHAVMPTLGVADDPEAKKIMAGFKINSMTMRDAANGRVFWTCELWDKEVLEKTETLPKDLLKCRTVTREINFSSVEEIRDFRLTQRVWLESHVIEEWNFQFGFVIPHSTNSWQQTIEAASPAEMLPVEVINEKVVIETLFLVKNKIIHRSKIRVRYQ